MAIFSAKGKFWPEPNHTQVGTPDDVNIYTIQRLKGFQNIQPVVSVGPQEESVKLQPLKNELEGLIDSLKKTGDVSAVSIYLKNFKRGRWISINADNEFHPASLMKVPLMLAVLKKAESMSGMLEKKIVYKKQPGKKMFGQHFQGPSIVEGGTYSIHDLIYYCAANSDNQATHALETNVDLSKVINLFEDIGLPKPDMQNGDYTISARDFSSFMETIFNAGFLSPEYSEYAAEMLGNSSFKEGFSKGMPANTKMWHKFGEWTRPESQEAELHESGVFFVDGKPYLLTVMTRGKDLDKLTTVLQKIAGLTVRRVTKAPMSIARTTSNFRSMGC
ncbi:MAG: class A beta-lactamase-related serine hydrolase [Saprospiraceae bacterium]|nr:class A beta-lactamase-related serine hydrolase [Saprospiraceae bacterium]MCF8248380.1 class A beta-lactamase-related serine hydrolase [Saprospiraceae bacterium]MCF8280051.1 class A beta-lactamase-related serine hydrolase [Bacteroidales bacterium]MCF8309908.1 class A beta-lactamase-related serine hydrolase [Saprospiraceae bacterium]